MFRAEVAWVGLVTGLAAVAAQTYLGRYRMKYDESAHKFSHVMRVALWVNRDELVEHLLTSHAPDWHQCPIAREIESAGWSVEAFVVAASFDCFELLEG